MAAKASAKVDLSEFFRLAQPSRPSCRIGLLLDQLPDDQAAQLSAACAQDVGIINTGAIQKWLASRNYQVSIPAITNHRRGTCSCARE